MFIAAVSHTQQDVATLFFVLAAFTFLLATFWLGRPNRADGVGTAWGGLIPLGLLLLSCGLLTAYFPS
jgi:hypothetical protein